MIAFAWRAHPAFELILAANRDEFHERPTRPAQFWPEHPTLLAGRDERAGGTWLGVDERARFAALSNYRDPRSKATPDRSRGALVRDFLTGSDSAHAYTRAVERAGNHYGGFNLIAADAEGLYYVSNRGAPARELSPGVYGLSNHLLDTPWPKLCRLRDAVDRRTRETRPDGDALFTALADTRHPPDAELPDTGVGSELERLLSPPFIVNERYGTRASTVVTVARDGAVRFEERSFDPNARPTGTRRHTFRAGA